MEFITNQLDNLFRHEAGKMVSVLSRLLGFEQLETAQDIVQDTLLQAMNSWPYSGIPPQPEAWLYRVAKNKAIDYLRRQKVHQKALKQYAAVSSEYAISAAVYNLFLTHEIEDSQLRMMFACCHPAISEESQVALVLKTLCGLSTSEIATAFLCHEDTIAKRIYRAKEKIKQGIPLEVPPPAAMPLRLDAVLQCLYLLFNEGYLSSRDQDIIRKDLCSEALRLCKLLCDNEITGVPKTKALAALFCYQASRFDARIDDQGNLILLQHQDRSKWNYFLIAKANFYMEQSGETDTLSHWHLEAAIASTHASAPSFESTNWPLIYKLYQLLCTVQTSPATALNKAIAASYAVGYEHGYNELMEIAPNFRNHLWYAVLADVYMNTNQPTAAKTCLEKAIAMALTKAEKKLLEDRLQQL